MSVLQLQLFSQLSTNQSKKAFFSNLVHLISTLVRLIPTILYIMGLFSSAATFKGAISIMYSIQAVVSSLFQAKTAIAVRVQSLTSLTLEQAQPLIVLQRLITLPGYLEWPGNTILLEQLIATPFVWAIQRVQLGQRAFKSLISSQFRLNLAILELFPAHRVFLGLDQNQRKVLPLLLQGFLIAVVSVKMLSVFR
jgi:hypothetical protein